ncbi:unnamed protein product [Adineta steineri]|uniref:Uncharacterized protein n=1 Tax=Adineta steineri TaxID=433720 RepID=A0A819LI02_9BILA|nr:unnamed protein product [Adineta steineri]CAF3961770.1 unnamed protein product [Adineta steineri]
MHQGINWQNHRKMTIQLLSTSTLYILLGLPYMLISLAWMLGMPSNVGLNFYVYFVFFSYFIVFLFPFVCAGTLPELGAKLKRLAWWRRQRRVVPNALQMISRMVDQRITVPPIIQ